MLYERQKTWLCYFLSEVISSLQLYQELTEDWGQFVNVTLLRYHLEIQLARNVCLCLEKKAILIFDKSIALNFATRATYQMQRKSAQSVIAKILTFFIARIFVAGFILLC